jgi:hypothetical protein
MDIIYDCIDTLPDSVKAALDDKGRRMWMDAFNSVVKKSGNKKTYRDAVYDAWQMMKTYSGCRFFSGFVSTEDLDKQNDVVMVEKAFQKINNHINRGGTMVDTHTNRTVGAFIFAEKSLNKTGKPGVKAYSVVYQGEPYYDTVWDQIKKGMQCPTCGDVRKGYSIGGFALDAQNTCDITGCHRDILDMSIHEISICQDPANPEAIIQEVNMMAKSESEVSKAELGEINKALRSDAPAAEIPEVAAPAVPAAQTAVAPEAQAAQAQDVAEGQISPEKQNKEALLNSLDPAVVTEWTKREHKKMEAWKKYLEMMRGITDPISSAGVAKAADIKEPTGTAPKCGCISDLHTSVTAAKCPDAPELVGDVNDAQVPHTMDFLENKDIEADESAKKDDKNLMPGKDEIHFKKMEKGPNAEVSEEGKNSAVEEKVEALAGPDDTKIVSKDLKEPGTEPKHEVPDKKVDQEMPTKPKTETKTVTEDGSPREKGFGKEGDTLMQKCPGDGKAQIPEDLMPLFQEFLQQKGIKLEPEVESREIEGPLEKTLYTDEDISELDLIELSDPIEFDSSVALGKSAVQRLKVHNMMARLKLAKSLKVADIEFLIDEPKKN